MNEGHQKPNDLALSTLLEVAHDIAPDLPEDLLRKVFALQREHQFDDERDVSLQELQRVLDDFVGQHAEEGSTT